MPQAMGKTYGFGRVSPETRPSPYTPMFLASVAPDIARAGDVAPNPVRPRRRRRLALALTIAVVVAASAIVAVGFVRSASRTAAERAPDVRGAAVPALDSEADRLGRSAFAATHNSAH